MPLVLLVLALVGMFIAFAYGFTLGTADKLTRLSELPPPNPDMAYRRSNSIKV